MSSPQRSPKHGAPRLPRRVASFPTISEDSAENQPDTDSSRTLRTRERLTSIARILLSGTDGSGSPADNENNLTAGPTNVYDKSPPNSPIQRPNALGLLTAGSGPTHKRVQSAMSETPMQKTSSPTNTPKRVSFESTRPAEVAQTTATPASSIPVNTQRQNQERSPTRSVSPRRFWPISRSHSHDDAFVPVDPYQFDRDCEHHGLTKRITFYIDRFFRQLYLLLLFRLPSVYFGRVRRVFEYAEISKPELKRMVELGGSSFLKERNWHPNNVPPALIRFKEAWEDFVDSILKEDKTLNVVSALLLSAILTIFQTDASDEPITRTAALVSLISAMWSLMLGCIFILRFQTMRSMRNASQWAEAAEGTTASIIWNVWVFLSMPAVFLCWSLVSFIISILAFVWTSGTVNPPSSISSTAAIGPRIFVTFTFVLGLVYFATAIRTFKSYTDSTEASEASRAVIEGRDRRAWSPRIRVLRNRPEDDLEKGLGSLEVGQAKKNIHGANGVNAGTHESGTGWDEILSPTGTMNARGRAPRDVVSPKMLLAGPFPRGTSV